MMPDTSKAIFAGGCFWGVEAAFRETPGVTSTRVGYIGGHTDNPTYREVCSHSTGHAEAVEVSYDPNQLMYEDLLALFWQSHDPTQLNRQGPDIGDNYRSAIFILDETQRVKAEASRDEEQSRRVRPIVTEITSATTFWEAEDYHQQYLEKRGLATCRISPVGS
jgi:peptide-methionine (S)-S-oxide reductase